MNAVGLTLYVLALIVLFGVRSWVQHRRTGSTGFRGISGTPAEAGWWGGVLFIAAVLLGLVGPLLAVTGTLPADPHSLIAVVGLVLALAGFAATLAGQTGMGASWRIGVEPGERTDLVTTGVFAYVRNPIFTAMALAQFGMLLLVPTWISAAALVALVAAVELQVRAVEEPYLLHQHGSDYADYAARTGRFVPGVGRIHMPGHNVLLVSGDRARQDEAMWALPAPFEAIPGLHRCSCCGGVYPARSLTTLAATPGAWMCRDCAKSAATRTRLRRPS